MDVCSTAESLSSGSVGRLGIYAPSLHLPDDLIEPGRQNDERLSLGQLQAKLPGSSPLQSLADEQLDGISCILADIRYDARQVLNDCYHAATILPVIALADMHQSFPADYPFGTHVADVTSTAELGESLFWNRVAKAMQSYEHPLSINDIASPVYGVFRTIADQTSDWIFIKDLKHRFVVAGENFAATAGVPIKHVIGRNDLEIGSSPACVIGDPKSGKPGFWPQDRAVYLPCW